ncbi:hypothetical protein GCM10010095_70700 [Streptomyces anthocyanicus]|uniref:Uncharacterized protein n=2 Tax=Streptomyces TaxID=1883 RepID=A0ABN3TE16_9ACTN|nr:hypothetical protein [Streptomyces anthocyanicus]GGL75575.1 hypothetical protein GCM10010095_70700 [Streptomyces anthocyanicus]
MKRSGHQRPVYLRMPGGPATTALLGTGSAGAALASGALPASSTLAWPLVALALGSMAYDLGVRALARWQ